MKKTERIDVVVELKCGVIGILYLSYAQKQPLQGLRLRQADACIANDAITGDCANQSIGRISKQQDVDRPWIKLRSWMAVINRWIDNQSCDTGNATPTTTN